MMQKVLFHHNLTRQTLMQLIRYGVSGASAVVVDYGSFTITLGVYRTSLFIATLTSLLAGFIVSFFLNRLWVFEAHKQTAAKKARMQLLLYGVLFSFNTLFTYLFIDYTGQWLHLNHYLAKLCCIALIMVWDFVLYKKLIFKLTHDDNFQIV